jgi:hypothetical protein
MASITVGIPADTGEGKFAVQPSIKDVSARQGEQGNQVQVSGRLSAPQVTPSAPPAAPVGDTVRTTLGDAKVHRTMTGDTYVTLPGKGIQLSFREAQAAGLILPDQGAPSGDANAKPRDRAEGDPEGDAKGYEDLPTVTPEALAEYADTINSVGDAFEKAGMSADDALTSAVTAFAQTGTLSGDVESALVSAFGADKAQQVVSRVQAHAGALIADAVRSSGISPTDKETLSALADHLDKHADVMVEALKGKPAKLNSAALQFAHGSAKASRRSRGY